MNPVLYLLFTFVGIGLAARRLGRATYPLMVLAITLYVAYAYTSG